MAMNMKLQPPVLIFGWGKSGQSAAQLLLEIGLPKSEILIFDQKNSAADYSSESDLMSITPGLVVVSPGVPLSMPILLKWKSAKIPICSEIDLAIPYLTDEKIVGITGSLGKSTTTSLIAFGIKAFDSNVFAGGNLGVPLCQYALELKKGTRQKADWVVLELSSYQLENCTSLLLNYSMITYLAPNHLERYRDLNDYYQTKFSILEKTKNILFLNQNGGDLKNFQKQYKEERIIWINRNHVSTHEKNSFQLVGDHNLDNFAMAKCFGQTLGFPTIYFDSILKFPGLPHRLENLGKKNNMLFINDSKATTIDSVIAAIAATESHHPDVPLLVLLGGKDKKLPWYELKDFLKNRTHRYVFFGDCGPMVKNILNFEGRVFSKLKLALDYLITPNFLSSYGITLNEKTTELKLKILFSPGGVSQDEFNNFEERGDFFKNWVYKI